MPENPRLSTPLTDLLAIRHPILLAPMDRTACAALAIAVSEAGGLGLLGGGYPDLDHLDGELAAIAASGARCGVGFITFALDERPEALDLALDASPVAVQLSFGDPRPYADRIHAAGSLLLCGVQSPDEVARAVEAGADVIVAQGADAGGHGRPDVGTLPLLPSVVDRVGAIPVSAAGGITDGRGLAAALGLGAAGVTMGTRFLASTLADSDPAEAAALVGAAAFDTVRTDAYDVVRGPAWPEGHDGRVVRNRFTDDWAATGDADGLRARYRASAPDDYDVRPLWAGQGLDLVTSIDSPAEIVARTVAEAVAALRSAAARIDG